MESQTTLVWAECRVELDAKATVHLQGALVILPDDAELNDTLGNGRDLQRGAVFWVVAEERAVFESAGQFWYHGRTLGAVSVCRLGRELTFVGLLELGF